MDREKTSISQKIAWFLFCGTCVELIVFNPYVKIITGVKSDVYSGLLCAFTLGVCVLVARKDSVRITLPEICISLVLLALAIASGIASSTSWSSSVHVFVLAATSLGGFWCARTVLNTRSRQKVFVWLNSIGLALISVLGLLGFYFHEKVTFFTVDTHLLADLIFLLSFGPLALMSWGKRGLTALGILLLGMSYVTLYITGITSVDSAVLVPMIVLIVALLVAPVRSGTKFALAVVLLVVVAVTASYIGKFSPKHHLDRDYNAVRLEYYPFSWHIAKESPLLGIGLRTPRENYLTNYNVWHPHYTKERFREDVVRYKVCQNMFLTLMVGLGTPFLILYVAALSALLFRLLRVSSRWTPDVAIPPLALLIPLTGSILHLLVMDLLMFPYIAWFFHILLGLIPSRQDEVPDSEPQPVVRSSSVMRSIPIAICVVVLGIFLGTHPAFDFKKLPSYDDVSAYVRSMPLLSAFFAKPPQGTEAPSVVPPGSLVVNIRDYRGNAVNWSVMCILDNSQSMCRHKDPWRPNRLRAASDMIQILANSMHSGCTMAVRGFVEEGPLRRKQAQVPLRVSRVLCNWTEMPAKHLEFTVAENVTEIDNNWCAAAENSLKKDFLIEDGARSRRILVITDGGKTISERDVLTLIQNARNSGNTTSLDIAALGAQDSTAERFSEIVSKTNGKLLRIENPDDVQRALSQYLEILAKPVPTAVVVSGRDQEQTMLPGAQISLEPGLYNITLPEIPGLVNEHRLIPDVGIEPNETSVLNITISQGKPVVEKLARKPRDAK